MALVDVNGTGATRLQDACLTINGGHSESMCSVVIDDIYRGFARNKTIDANCQVDRLWGFWKTERGNGQFLSAGMSWLKYNDVRQSSISSLVVKSLYGIV